MRRLLQRLLGREREAADGSTRGLVSVALPDDASGPAAVSDALAEPVIADEIGLLIGSINDDREPWRVVGSQCLIHDETGTGVFGTEFGPNVTSGGVVGVDDLTADEKSAIGTAVLARIKRIEARKNRGARRSLGALFAPEDEGLGVAAQAASPISRDDIAAQERERIAAWHDSCARQFDGVPGMEASADQHRRDARHIRTMPSVRKHPPKDRPDAGSVAAEPDRPKPLVPGVMAHA